MINLKKGTSQSVTLTLSENTTLSSPYYLFVFESVATSTFVRFNATDGATSAQTARYNLFTIEENDTADLDNGVVSLEEGQHDYTIYEVATATEKDESTASATLEKGIVIVYSDETQATEYEPTAETVTAYDPD